MPFEQKSRPLPRWTAKDVAEQLCPSSSAYSLAAGYPASPLPLYAVLAGRGADGGLWGTSRDVQCGLSTGAVRNGGR